MMKYVRSRDLQLYMDNHITGICLPTKFNVNWTINVGVTTILICVSSLYAPYVLLHFTHPYTIFLAKSLKGMRLICYGEKINGIWIRITHFVRDNNYSPAVVQCGSKMVHIGYKWHILGNLGRKDLAFLI